jgi:environmental stress-induced protein Ves
VLASRPDEELSTLMEICEPRRDHEDSRDIRQFAARISAMAAKSGEIGAFLFSSSYSDYDRFLSILSSGYFIYNYSKWSENTVISMYRQMAERMSG